jgi:hypothetical protein
LALGSAQLVKKFHDPYCREALARVRFKASWQRQNQMIGPPFTDS